METEVDIARDPWIVAVEETQYLEEDTKSKTGRFWMLYLVDRGTTTNLCSLTPSYWLMPYDFVTEKQIDDDLQGDLYTCTWNANYYDCSYIDSLEPKGLIEAASYLKGETMERAEEHLRGNTKYPQGLWSLIKYE